MKLALRASSGRLHARGRRGVAGESREDGLRSAGAAGQGRAADGPGSGGRREGHEGNGRASPRNPREFDTLAGGRVHNRETLLSWTFRVALALPRGCWWFAAGLF